MQIKDLDKELESVFLKNGITRHAIKLIPGNTKTLEISIMKADGSMDMDTCVLVSREISEVLDRIDYSDEAYNLDVCSFGAEYELENDEDIVNSIGEYVHADLIDPKDGYDQYEGKLLEYEDGVLKIEFFIKGRRKTASVKRADIRFIRRAVKL